MSLLSKLIFVFLVAAIVSSSEDFTNGAAPLYYPTLAPGVPLADKFDIIRNTDFVKNLTAARKMTRTAKLENLEKWLRGYSIDKYDLINMYDRMLTIQTRAKYIMMFYLNRVAILQVELMRSNLNKIIGTQNKMTYVTSFKYTNFSDNYFKPAYFYFDIDWQKDYNSTKYLPAHQVFIDYYFPTHVQTILNNTKLTVDRKIATINYTLLGFEVPNDEETTLKQYYRYYLTTSN